MIEVEIQSKIAEVKREMQWESERKSIALAKLRKLFLDSMEVELILLHAFKTDACVATFRTGKIDPDLQSAINDANAQKERPPAPRVSVLTLLKDPEEVPKEKNVATIDRDDSEEHHSKAEDSAALQDMRRLRLKKMVADYEKYIDGKQFTKFENEDDIAAIRYAENNMGDFKLKSDLEHVRPISQQTNAKKKRNEMLLLKEAVFQRKIEFNKEFLALRDIKMQISSQIHEKNARIQEINNILRIKDELLYVPPHFKDERPELRDHVSDKDIEEHCQNLKRMEELQKAQEKKGLDFGGMSTKSKPDEKIVSLQPSGKRMSLDESSRKEVDKLQKANVSAQARVFALSTLEELKVLRTMQPKEEALESRHVVKLAELSDMSGKVSEQDKVLEQKKQELHALNEKKKQLMEEFEELLGENHPAKEALLKIYLRKVKLSKGLEDEDDENLDEDIDMNDSKGSEDDFDEDEVVEVCPPACDQELYQKVCQLRERRTIEDSLLQESNKQLDGAMKEHAACLHVSADLQESIQLRNKNMKQKAGSPYRDIFVEKRKAELEYDHLCKVVAVQKQRIEKLNQELKAIQKERRKVFP